MSRILVTGALALALAGGLPARAESRVPTGYESAVAPQGISPLLFYAMALTESGQSEMTAGYRPWPWTLSINGKPHFYPSRRSAGSALRAAIDYPAQQLGVGLFQIEYRYHSERFESPEAMLDPYLNSRVAAEILAEGLQRSNGDVWAAVGTFHSGTPELAEAYRERVARRLVSLLGKGSDDR